MPASVSFTVPVSPAHIMDVVLILPVGRLAIVMAIVLAALVPQPLFAVAVTLSVPEVAELEKLMVLLFPLPLMVAPLPL